MGKYNYLNLNQKMIKIRKKIPALIRKRYSEDVNYDFVKLDDINQFLTPALNRYGVDFDILRELPTQTDASGNLVFLTADGNLWRYEADLDVCWTNADRPEERITATVHLVGTNDVADKAKGTAMTYGLKYYLLNKFNIPQNGDEDPDMRGVKPTENLQQAKDTPGKKEEKKKQAVAGAAEKAVDGYMPGGSLEEGLGDMMEHTGGGSAGDKVLRSGNAISAEKAGNMEDKAKRNPEIQRIQEKKEEEPAPKEEPEDGGGKTCPQEEDFDCPEEDFDFSEEDESGEESLAEENAGDGFRSVRAEDEVPFPADEEGTTPDTAQAEDEDDKVEKAKTVICNFGYFQGRTLGEMLETPKGWESLKWIKTRYKGANTQMKEAATILVEAGAYMPDAA